MTEVFSSKFNDEQCGIYLFGTAPPKQETSAVDTDNIASKLLARFYNVEFDAMVVYDIQDESSRTSENRPFPFMQTLDPCFYSQLLRKKSGKTIITYKSVSQQTSAEFSHWLDTAQSDYEVKDTVLVGSPSSSSSISLSLNQAYELLAAHRLEFNLGGICIAERHASSNTEHLRLQDKSQRGCNFFISQAVYNAQATIDMLSSYARICRQQGKQPKRVILTFTPCGSEKTLEFMKWLGISIPQATEFRILDAPDPLQESIHICRNNLEQILEAVVSLNIPLGLNIESLTNRKNEIDASIYLFRLLKSVMELKLAETIALPSG